VDSSIIVESELGDDPWDARDGDQSVKDEPSEESPKLLSSHTHTFENYILKFDNITILNINYYI